MWKNQTTYDDEFRWNAVDLYINSDRSMAEVASGLGISTGALREWKRKILGGSGGEVSPAWDKTRGGRTRHYQERKENEAEPKGA